MFGPNILAKDAHQEFFRKTWAQMAQMSQKTHVKNFDLDALFFRSIHIYFRHLPIRILFEIYGSRWDKTGLAKKWFRSA